MDILGDTLTASLMEEVFQELDDDMLQSSATEKSISKKPAPTFLEEEYENDMQAALGKKVKETVGNDVLDSPRTPAGAVDREIELLTEELNMSDDTDILYNGNKMEWVMSQTILKSKNNTSYYSDGIPKNNKKWAGIKEKSDSKISKLDSSMIVTNDLLLDPVFHMRIINPKVSTSVLKERMIGREAVSTAKIKHFLASNDLKEMNWVTGGAIVGKVITKSQKGNQYCIWNLSDLRGDIKYVSVYLFGNAYRDFWKLPLGAVVGILNPAQLNNKTNNTEATLKVDNSDKIMIFGTSKDYGICKSKKANGENCTVVVNKSVCEYCIYHVKKVYDKASRRPELQSNFTGRGLVNLRNKVLGKNEVFYGGKSYTAIVGKQSINTPKMERECQKLKTLAIADNSTKTKKDNELLSRLNNMTPRRNNDVSFKLNKINMCESKISVNNKINENKQTPSTNRQDTKINLDKSETVKMIDLNLPITRDQIRRAHANALKFIREKGPLKKPDDSSPKRTPEQIASLKRRLESEDREKKRMKTSVECENDGNVKSLLEQKKERSGITERFLELMNSKAQNDELLSKAEAEEREKYFSTLEIREKMETKMASTFKIECKAVRCLKCNYKSFSASELCKKEKHPIKVVNAIKRFWKCGDCSARTVCLELVPLHPCKVCGSSKWERASMLPEKKAKANEILSIRGHEEKFLGSNVKNANINLLVPDEGP